MVSHFFFLDLYLPYVIARAIMSEGEGLPEAISAVELGIASLRSQ